MCTPGFSHARSTIGSAADVAVTSTSATRTASSADRDLLDALELAARRACGSTRRRGRSGARRASRRDGTCAWMPAPRIASVLHVLAGEQPRRDARDGGRADSRDRAGVQDRPRLAGLAVEERDEALVRVEPARARCRGRSQRPSARRAARRRRGARASAPSGSPRPAAGRRTAAGCAPRRARAPRAPPPSRRCTRPSAAAAERRARRESRTVIRRTSLSGPGRPATGRAREPARIGSRCAGRFGPHTAPSHGCEHPGERQCSHRDAARVGLLAQAVEPVEDAVVDELLRTARGAWSSASLPGTARRAVLAGQPAAGERTERHVRDGIRLSTDGSTSFSSPRSSRENAF